MYSKDEILRFKEKVCTSTYFAKSENIRNLLNFLVEKSLKGEIVKETTIATDFLEKDITKDGYNESNVRVYVHQLRKKLEKYYENEGKQDTIRLKIPKGSYYFTYESQQNRKKKRFYSIIGSSIFLILLIVVLALRGTQIFGYQSKIWSNFTDKKSQLLYVLGDFYFYEGPVGTGRDGLLRDYQVNIDEDFDSFKKEDSTFDALFSKSKLTYLNIQTAYCLFNISHLLDKKFEHSLLKLSSELIPDDLNNYDIIYLGGFKNLQNFKPYIKNLNFEYDINKSILQIKDDNTGEIKVFHVPEFNQQIDYSILAKIKGPNNNHLFMFISNHDIGNIMLARHFTKISNYKKFEKEHALEKDSSFIAIFKVTGQERAAYKLELEFFNYK